MSNWQKISSDLQILKNVYKKRHSLYNEKKVSKNDISSNLHDGWEISKEYKNGSALVKKIKNHFDAFEDRLWCLFYKMKFTNLNLERSFRVSYSDQNPNLTKQIDVFAADDETILLIECKSTAKPGVSSFKDKIEAYSGIIEGLRNEIRKQYPNRKIAMIWATNNYDLGEQDAARLRDFRFIHFSEKTVSYFENLADHLGSASKYQLLGFLFPNQDIKNLNSVVPAIQGSMGGHKYYSFMIKPEDLLKFSYVLHRNNANNEMMPTYQRLIKKERLLQIREFIDVKKGYFPNSIIINIDEEMKFELSQQKNSSTPDAKIGLLYLPKKYRRAYIIDGQHRVYGYSDTEYASKHTIPVVAFVKLEQSEQVKMFMDINENQKAVSKVLRNTLIKDLYLESDNKNEVREAQCLIIADKLGEFKKSPLYNRVLIGENKKTDTTSITLENLKIAILKNSDYLSKFNKNNTLLSLGTFDFDDTTKTTEALSDFLIRSFNIIKEYNEDEWNKGSKDGYLATNNYIMAVIYLLNDFVNLKNLNARETETKLIASSIENLLLALCDVFSRLTPERITELKKSYGAGGPNLIHKELGYEVSLIEPEYNPDWLIKYIEENKQNNILESGEILKNLKNSFVQLLKNKLKAEKLSLDIVDEKLYEAIEHEITQTKIKYQKDGKEFTGDFWSILTFELIGRIINNKSNWSTYFKDSFDKLTVPDGKKTRDIMSVLFVYESKVRANSSLSLTEFDWLVKLEKDTKDHLSISDS